MALAESSRVDATVFQHSTYYRTEERLDRAAHRYLHVLEQALGSGSDAAVPDVDRQRFHSLRAVLERLRVERVPGDVVDWGAGGVVGALVRAD